MIRVPTGVLLARELKITHEFSPRLTFIPLGRT